ncbi:hypothetical protein SHIRM173S_04466 [Streptomyces hirsutus]
MGTVGSGAGSGAGEERPPHRVTMRPGSAPGSSAAAAPALRNSGLFLVTTLADDWGVTDRCSGPGKTVWAVVGTVPGSRVGALHQAPAGSPGAEPGSNPSRAAEELSQLSFSRSCKRAAGLRARHGCCPLSNR